MSGVSARACRSAPERCSPVRAGTRRVPYKNVELATGASSATAQFATTLRSFLTRITLMARISPIRSGRRLVRISRNFSPGPVDTRSWVRGSFSTSGTGWCRGSTKPGNGSGRLFSSGRGCKSWFPRIVQTQHVSTVSAIWGWFDSSNGRRRIRASLERLFTQSLTPSTTAIVNALRCFRLSGTPPLNWMPGRMRRM